MDKISLAQKYRPHRFDSVVGQQAAKEVLKAMVRREALPAGLLFSGPHGTGKTSIGRLVAAALNCSQPPAERPCGGCQSCLDVQAGTHLAVREIDGATHGTVAEIRRLKNDINYSVGDAHLVVLLDEVQSVSREGNNSMLGMLEELPPNVTFILLTTEPWKLLDTVLSRLVQIPFSKISTADVLARLKQVQELEDFSDLDSRLLLPIAEWSKGSLRDGLNRLDLVARSGINTVEHYTEVFGEPDVGPLLLAEILSGNSARVYLAVERALLRVGDAFPLLDALVSAFRDVLVLHSEPDSLAHLSPTALTMRQSLARQLGQQSAFEGLKLLWQLQTETIAGHDPRVMLDLVTQLLVKLLTNGEQTVEPAKPAARMSLGEMSNTPAEG